MVTRDTKSKAAPASGRASASGEILPLDFNIVVLSLNTSALIQLGEAEGAVGEREANLSETNLSMAQQTIDMLGILEEKTRGNLTGEEERLLHQVLFDLRMRYARKAGTSPR